jgi:transcription elongation factor GreA
VEDAPAARWPGLSIFLKNQTPPSESGENALLRRKLTMDRFPITRDGYNRLRTELQRLEKEERPQVIQAIAEAREHGDISENAEFEAAKERQALVEGKINDLHSKLGECEIVEMSEGSVDRVTFGSTVDLEDLDTGEKVRYRLVGPYEADLAQGTISVTSPIGRALIGKEAGDDVRVQTPGGVKNLEILDIHYAAQS